MNQRNYAELAGIKTWFDYCWAFFSKNRAKKQLQSMLLMNLESRPVVFEDVARQVLTSGARKESTYYIDAIERVTPQDIQRVAKRMLKSKPSVAALGSLEVSLKSCDRSL